jgi:hypothetical protein
MASFIPLSYSGPGVSASTNDVIPYGPVLQWQLVGNPGSHGGTGATGSFNAPGVTGATGGITGLFYVENLCGDPSNPLAILQRATDTSSLQQWVRRPTAVGPTAAWMDWVLNGPGSGGGSVAGVTGITGGTGVVASPQSGFVTVSAIPPVIVQTMGTGVANYESGSSYANVDSGLNYTTVIPLGYKLTFNMSCCFATTTGVGFLALFDGATGICSTITQSAQALSASLAWTIVGDGASHSLSLQFMASSSGMAIVINEAVSGILCVPVVSYRLEVAS